MFNGEVLKEAAAAAFLDLAEKASATVGGALAKEEAMSAGYEAVFRAMLAYNPERGPFGPFAARCVQNAVISEVKRWREECVPLENVQFEAEQTESGDLEFLEGRERALARMLLAGYSKKECAQKMGLSNGMVSYLCRKIAEKLTKERC